MSGGYLYRRRGSQVLITIGIGGPGQGSSHPGKDRSRLTSLESWPQYGYGGTVAYDAHDSAQPFFPHRWSKSDQTPGLLTGLYPPPATNAVQGALER